MNNSLVQENQPKQLDASNELQVNCSISQVKERLQDNTKSSAQSENQFPAWSSDNITREKNVSVKPLQLLNKDQNLPKDWVSDMHKALVSEKRLENVVTKMWVVFFDCAFSCSVREMSYSRIMV